MLAFVHYPHASQWHTKQKPHGEAVAHTSGLGPMSALRCNNRSVNLTSSPGTSTSKTLNVSLQVLGEVARRVQLATQAKSAEWSASRHSVTKRAAWCQNHFAHFFPPTRTHEPRKPQSLGRSYLKVAYTQACRCPSPVTWITGSKSSTHPSLPNKQRQPWDSSWGQLRCHVYTWG